jgi:phosphoglycerate dehydrogenase-like enzyme
VTPDVWIPADTPRQHREALRTIATLHELPTGAPVAEYLGHGDLLIAGREVERALDAVPRIQGLRAVQVFSAGVDSIVDRIPRGVILCDASGVHDVSVAEWIVLAILASYRSLPSLLAAQQDGTWLRDPPRGEDLQEARVLILGYGSIGRALEERLVPFGVVIDRVARRPRPGVQQMDHLPDLISVADIVVVLLPLTDQTRGIVGTEALSRMRPGALLVNASRGAVVDTAALVEALSMNRIRAVLDVTDPEPLPDGHPLWSMPGVLITPHLGGDVRREADRAWRLAIEQVGRFARGEPLNNIVVDGY